VFESAQSPAEWSAIVARAPSARSAITNDPLRLRGVDGRSATARRYRDLCMEYADTLGGAAVLGPAVQAMIRQAAAITIQMELLQAKIVAGEDVDLEQLTRVSNVLTRMLHRLGLRKPAPARGPTLADGPLASHFARPLGRR
jgi:hypothetical protein